MRGKEHDMSAEYAQSNFLTDEIRVYQSIPDMFFFQSYWLSHQKVQKLSN